jgi:hypothetical protein
LTCPTAAACDGAAVNGRDKYRKKKSITVSTWAGTASVDVMCRVVDSFLAPEVSLGTLSGLTCDDPADCILETRANCESLWLRVSACDACYVSGWIAGQP